VVGYDVKEEGQRKPKTKRKKKPERAEFNQTGDRSETEKVCLASEVRCCPQKAKTKPKGEEKIKYSDVVKRSIFSGSY